jgi:hypothetical protein
LEPKRVNTIVGTSGNAGLGLAAMLATQAETIRKLVAEVTELKRGGGS